MSNPFRYTPLLLSRKLYKNSCFDFTQEIFAKLIWYTFAKHENQIKFVKNGIKRSQWAQRVINKIAKTFIKTIAGLKRTLQRFRIFLFSKSQLQGRGIHQLGSTADSA